MYTWALHHAVIVRSEGKGTRCFDGVCFADDVGPNVVLKSEWNLASGLQHGQDDEGNPDEGRKDPCCSPTAGTSVALEASCCHGVQ